MAKKENAKRKPGLFQRLLRIFGIQFMRERGHWLLLTRRFRLIVLASIILIVGAFAFFFFYVTTRPGFCNSCHIMEPYVASWKESSHKDVLCNDCHYPPGWRNMLRGKVAALSEVIKTLTGTEGPKLHAEIEDASCLREGCHETRLLEGEVVFKGKYKFDHQPHLTL